MSDTTPPTGDQNPAGGPPTPPPAPGAVPPPPGAATPPPPAAPTPPPPGGVTPPPPPGGATPPPPAAPTPPAPPAPPGGATPPPAYTPPPAAPYSPPPAGGPKSTSNGMAIAALVLGILSFVCLGPIAGVLAIVFGILGMKKANEVGTGKGMAIAGMVLGIIGTIVTILVFVFVIAAGDSVNNAFDDATGAADPNDYELVSKSCEIDNFGFVTFTGTIENTGSKDLDFTIDGEIRNSSSNVIVESPSTIVSVPEGDTVQWELVSSVDDSITQVECKVTGVNNWFN